MGRGLLCGHRPGRPGDRAACLLLPEQGADTGQFARVVSQPDSSGQRLADLVTLAESVGVRVAEPVPLPEPLSRQKLQRTSRPLGWTICSSRSWRSAIRCWEAWTRISISSASISPATVAQSWRRGKTTGRTVFWM